MARITPQVRQLYAMCATALADGRADLDGADEVGFDITLPVFTVTQVGELCDIHPQTLRQYDRIGLVVPQRTDGGSRRYSLRDIVRLAEAKRLSLDEGINLAGITRILELQEENRQLRRQLRRATAAEQSSVFSAGRDGSVVEVQRGNSARTWRRSLRTQVRELPARVHDDEVRDESKSIVVWEYR